MKHESASRALPKQKGDLGTVHLIVYIFPLKDFALNLIFFFNPSLADLGGKTDPHCAAKILHFPVSLELWQFTNLVFLMETFKCNKSVKKSKSLKGSGYSLLFKC